MNAQHAQQNYLRTKVLTATPEQLQLMLYDGAIRFAEQAKVALLNKNYEESYRLISREVGLSKNTVADIVKRSRAHEEPR